VDPDADPDPDFYFMRMLIRVPKMMRIRIHNTAANHIGTFLKGYRSDIELLWIRQKYIRFQQQQKV
jgi:hypothetical protein